MDDATQKLVDEGWDKAWGFRRETRSWAEESAARTWFDHGVRIALEAAQRPGKTLTEFKGDGVWRDETGTVWITQPEATDAVKSALAQRPPVSPEVREAVRAVVGEQLTKAGLDLNGPPYSDDGEDQWPFALELRDCLTAALLARFSFSVLDAEKVARVIQIAANSSEDRSPGQTRAEWYAAALVAALRAGELTREETNE